MKKEIKRKCDYCNNPLKFKELKDKIEISCYCKISNKTICKKHNWVDSRNIAKKYTYVKYNYKIFVCSDCNEKKEVLINKVESD